MPPNIDGNYRFVQYLIFRVCDRFLLYAFMKESIPLDFKGSFLLQVYDESNAKDHQQNRQEAHHKVVEKYVYVMVEQTVAWSLETKNQGLHGAIGVHTRNHGKQRRERQGFAGALPDFSQKDCKHSDRETCYETRPYNVKAAKVHQHKSGDVAYGRHKAATCENPFRHIADASKSDSCNGSEKSVLK